MPVPDSSTRLLSCACCDNLFRSKTAGHIFCSEECRKKSYSIKQGLPPREILSKTCRRCGKVFTTYRANKIFCSKFCYVSSNSPRLLTSAKQPTSGSGAARELLVCADLIIRGIVAFRALSPDSPCDLVILKDGKLLRVEVTSAKRKNDGAYTYSPHDPDRYDILALVFGDKTILYVPDIAG
jgi:hypothetical protein